MTYNFTAIAHQRANGATWAEIAEPYGVDRRTVARAYKAWKETDGEGAQRGVHPFAESVEVREPFRRETDSVLLTREDVSRITSLEDLLEFFEVDTEAWQVNTFRVNKWENFSVEEGITPLYQVRANLGRNKEHEAEIARQLYEQATADMREHEPPEYPNLLGAEAIKSDEEPKLLVVAVFDPHIGMYAWEQEVGADYDSSIAIQDYDRAVEHALATARHYNVERVLYVVGNDLAHVDHFGHDARGGTRGGATSAGTMQDFDSRLPKMFTLIRRAVVRGIDKARLVAPVDVRIVPGNHDEQTMYRLGEVLAAWYRGDERVDVFYDPLSDDSRRWPRRRQFHQYGKNALMLVHGTEIKRKRDPLPLVMATEIPAEMWASTTHREILTGHNHIRMSGRYEPEADVTESRAIITRSLPGLTPEDSWHYNQGYKHARGSSALIYRKSGGLAGLHEFTP